jgi:hypothetical protein
MESPDNIETSETIETNSSELNDDVFSKCVEKSFRNDLDHIYENNEDIERDIRNAINYIKSSPARFHIVTYLSSDGSLNRAIRRGLEEYSEELFEQIHHCSQGNSPCSDYMGHE